MGREHLKPGRFKDRKLAVAAAKRPKPKGRNHKNHYIQKLYWLRKKGITDDTAREMMQIMVDGNFSSLDIYRQIKKLQASAQDNKEEVALLGRLMEWHKLQHGDKKQLDVKVASVDLNQPLSDDAKRLLLGDWED